MQQNAITNKRCGYIAIVGRPNVGKSTLLNHLLGQKLSITSRKPQTTRHRILGIKTENNIQAIYVDTPGIHKTSQHDKAINRYMNQAAFSALPDVDVVVFVVDRLIWTDEDEIVLKRLENCHNAVILVVNKIDRIENKEQLMPWLDRLSRRMNFAHIVPLSALKGHNMDRLERLTHDFLPTKTHFFDEDQITDRSCRFLAAEIVREKIMRQIGAELPYQVTVEIEQFVVEENLTTINALILVERSGQKKIVIGEKGNRLKRIGMEARTDMEKMFDQHVMLHLWVKVRSGWADDERSLASLGYD
ncbi:MAG: GTPase Era [Endozoicomonadaceae bacterium]|nr:GTPase Era [Endozoicomonadaceae bacterium]